ncbi:MAG TPA: hypothetical protein VI756_14225 [Blastocatellia bacterium]
MTTSTNKPSFSGPYSEALTELAETVESVTAEHGTSFVKAGDNKVYALGGSGYVVVLDETGWNGLVEVLTPKTTVMIRPADGGGISVSAGDLSQDATIALLKETSEKLRSYYDKRYWRTPRIA